jgi:hypothetical protein
MLPISPQPTRPRPSACMRLARLIAAFVLVVPALAFIVAGLDAFDIVSAPAAGAATGTIASAVQVQARSYASTVLLQATVTQASGSGAPVPTGIVDFYQDVYGSDIYIGSGPVGDGSGVAALVTSNLSGGNFSIVAQYPGDGWYAPSSGFVAFDYVPTKVAPVVSGSTSTNPLAWGAPGTVNGMVAAPAGAPTWYVPQPSGTITITDTTNGQNIVLGSGAVANGAYIVPTFWTDNAPTDTFSISYAGDTNYLAGATSIAFPVTPATVSTTKVTASKSSFVQGQSVSATATVTSASGTPTGSVTFYDGAFYLGPAALANGTASISLAGLAVGSHQVRAVFGGNSAFQGSTSSSITETVTAALAPVANAGAAVKVVKSATAPIDGSASTDPQGEPLTYQWSQLDGPTLTIADKHAAKTNITAPNTTGTAHLRLTVTNTAGLSSTSDLPVTISPK